MPNRSIQKALAMLALALVMSACGGSTPTPEKLQTPVFHAAGNPGLLSDWNIAHIEDSVLVLNENVLPFDLNSPLFTDYAHKLRTVWMPEGVSANYTQNDALDFPVGTIISKTFYYPRLEGDTRDSLAVVRTDDYGRDYKNTGLDLAGLDLANVRLMETRIIAHREEGWIALPYVWNEAQTEAVLKRAGDLKNLNLVNAADGVHTPFPYIIPNSNQCAGCHGTNSNTREIKPIGPKARHLNKNYAYADGIQNQLAKFTKAGYLTGLPPMGEVAKTANWQDMTLSLQERARGYLDINCAHCHSTVGPADTSGLHLEPSTKYGSYLGVCKVSVSAGAGTGGFLYDIDPGHADTSIIPFRMNSIDPGIMMPELGRSTIHAEGVALINAWITQLDGNCGDPQTGN
ncbi:MAG: hypothetical protein COA69_05610 [Robiginitomaculum sp.]|nr:MAG: hypothetical protein COA69_05610 [Robiginitomaculum sp.]